MLLYQLVEIRKKLDELSKYEGVEFAYAVFKNKKIIDKKLEEVDFIKNVDPEVIEYENKRIEICETFSDKDDNGKPLIDKDLYVIRDRITFENEMKKLNEDYKDHLEKREQQIKIFNDRMNETANIDLVKVQLNDVPADFKTANDLETISFMLD